jgi:molecular chaperone HtpG
MTTHADVLSIESRNVFGILKKWLYAEPDVVFRELISNAADAVAKLAELMGNTVGPGRIDVLIDVATRRLVISDNGLGMTAEEVDKYINQIAFSGASEFVNALEDEDSTSLIGQFGVGFYSAFMLADHVQLLTRSYQADADPVQWDCDSEMAFRMGSGDRAEVGTSVILDLNPDSPYLADPELALSAIKRFFRFLATEIRYTFQPAEPDAADPARYRDTLVNDPNPVWRRPAAQVAPEEMRAFYRDHFGDGRDPLFWLPIESVDLGLRGIVFFRDTKAGAEALDGRFEVFSKGVFIDSNPQQLVPKFANLQNGIIECDQLPLVVSRGQVRNGGGDDMAGKVAECLSQELAIALHAMFTQERPRYEEIWRELAAFVKYGVLTDRIFASVMTRRLLFASVAGELLTLGEYLEQVAPDYPGTVFYTSDPVGQAAYVEAFRASGVPALILDHVIDQPLLQRLEAVTKDVRFVRLDAEASRVLALEPDPADADLAACVVERFARFSADRLSGADTQPVWLRVADLPVVLTSDEGARRMSELAQMSGLVSGRAADELAVPRTLLVNLRNPLVRRIGDLPEPLAATAIAQLVDLILLGQDELSPEQLLGFLTRSHNILTGYLATTEE